MSVTSARNQAEALVDALGIRAAPVDVEGIARTLGLQIVFTSLEQDVSGVLITGPQGSCIAIRREDVKTRQRFSIAHELGHYCLRHQFEAGGHVHVDKGYAFSKRNGKSSTGTDIKEIEANQFSASLLMPSKLVRECIRTLNTDELYDSHVTALSHEFQVSEQAMTIRLSALGLL
jgi:Zn-dependent peptidase ImmA (M78 family)